MSILSYKIYEVDPILLIYGILLTLMREMNDRNDIFANTFEVN